MDKLFLIAKDGKIGVTSEKQNLAPMLARILSSHDITKAHSGVSLRRPRQLTFNIETGTQMDISELKEVPEDKMYDANHIDFTVNDTLIWKTYVSTLWRGCLPTRSSNFSPEAAGDSLLEVERTLAQNTEARIFAFRHGPETEILSSWAKREGFPRYTGHPPSEVDQVHDEWDVMILDFPEGIGVMCRKNY